MQKYIMLILLILSSITIFAQDVITITLPKADTLTLVPYATFDFAEIDESSAIVKSRVWENVYWTLNDSGRKNRIFPFNRNGELYRAEWYKEKDGGVNIGDAVNIDWEGIATDNDGNLYIGACGNNLNARRDLAIYILKDPQPYSTGTTRYFHKINFYYPEQTEFPAVPNNYDCEAIFWANGKLYLLTKHRADTQTHLYRFDSMDPLKENPVKLLSTFDIGGMVTSADATIDGKKLAVLTYNSIWLFESETDDYFHGKISWLPIKAKQCEAVCFDDNETLIITNEQMELFEIKLDMLIEVK
ncbi:MAG: hypothetical protein ISS80_05785 [Candidatus Cloacimonetes bacterium]|nr:hypothetical protein [Candidatus Cloacimonadota bacterium]